MLKYDFWLVIYIGNLPLFVDAVSQTINVKFGDHGIKHSRKVLAGCILQFALCPGIDLLHSHLRLDLISFDKQIRRFIYFMEYTLYQCSPAGKLSKSV